MQNNIVSYIKKHNFTLKNVDHNKIQLLVDKLIEVRESNANVYIIGNGGSASTASHICADFNICASKGLDKKFKFICPTDNISSVTSISNDVNYEKIFVEYISNFITKNDALIALSGSGNSANVIKAIEYANDAGVYTIGLSGYNGGKLHKKVKLSIHVNVNDMQISEDIHLAIMHIALQQVIKKLNVPSSNK